MRKEYKSIFLMKVPYCSYDRVADESADFKTKSTFRPVPSLALAALAGFIDEYKSFDYQIRAVDVNIEAYEAPGLPVNMTQYDDLLEKSIREHSYDVLCLSVMFVFNYRWGQDAVRYSRKYHPDAKIIVGGGYPTLFPDHCMENLVPDDIVVGEGEVALLTILNRYNHHRDKVFEARFQGQGIESCARHQKVIKRDNDFIELEYLPLPAWHYLNVDKYFSLSGDYILPIEGSRGCPYRCTYCCTYLSWGRKVRTKSIDNLLKEIDMLSARYPVRQLHFVDDNLSFYRDWLMTFLDRLIEKMPAVKLSASNFSIKHLDEPIIDRLLAAKMDDFGIAVESGSSEIQQKINKKLDFDKARSVVKWMKARGIKVHICWMIGFPNETINQINETFNLVRELQADSNQFLTVLPYPGTQLFAEAKAAGLLVLDDMDLDKYDFRKCDYLKSDEWNYDMLQEMAYDINIETNFLNSPLLKANRKIQDKIAFFEGVIKKLPEHVIAHMVLGYLYGSIQEKEKQEYHYSQVFLLLERNHIKQVFGKYMEWDHCIINEIKMFRRKNATN